MKTCKLQQPHAIFKKKTQERNRHLVQVGAGKPIEKYNPTVKMQFFPALPKTNNMQSQEKKTIKTTQYQKM